MGARQTGNLGGITLFTWKHHLEAGDEAACRAWRLKESENIVTYNQKILAVISRTNCTVF